MNPDIGIVLHGMEARAFQARLGQSSTSQAGTSSRFSPALRCRIIPSSSRPSTPPPARRARSTALRDTDTLPPRLAEGIAEVELDDDGRPRRIKFTASLPRAQY